MHRTASINEYSTRYSEAIDERATTHPTAWRLQSTANRQGSGAGCVAEFPSNCFPVAAAQPGQTAGEYLTAAEQLFHSQAQLLYEERLRFGVAKEVARKDLPLSTFTEAHWKVDLHNLLHYLSLRLDPHAQLEIRRYAEIIAHEIVAKLFPTTWDAFVDYRLEAISLTRLDQFVLRSLAVGSDMVDGRWVLPQFLEASKTVWPVDARSRERDECLVKLQRLGLVESDVILTPA